MVTAEILATDSMLDRTTARSFYDKVREFVPLVFVIQGTSPAVKAALADLPEDIGTPLAAMTDAYAVASEAQWFETPESLAAQLTPLADNPRIAVLGIAIGAKPEYISALAAALRH